MTGIPLKRLGTGAALLALGGCAYVTPYPSAFPPAATSNACAEAVTEPGTATKVYDCLVRRGREWDERGVAIRRQSGFVGQMSIPLGIAGLGLSAGNDRSDFVPISSGVNSAAMAHTGAYARPTQAEVYELATVAYRCLISAVADWNSAGKPEVNDALTELDRRNDAALRAIRATVLLDPAVKLALESKLLAQKAQAHVTDRRLDGSIGTALLRQSDEVDAAVIRAIRDRLPDPQAVAASISLPATSTPPTKLVDDGAGGVPNGNFKGFFGENSTSPEASTIDDLVRASDQAAAGFDAAVAAYAAHARTVPTTCVFNPSLLPGLSATPNAVTLDSTGKGFFIVRNGVPPYGHLPLPTGVELTPTPLGGNGMRFEVTGPAGPSKIYIIDASPGGAVVEVTVTGAAAAPT